MPYMVTYSSQDDNLFELCDDRETALSFVEELRNGGRIDPDTLAVWDSVPVPVAFQIHYKVRFGSEYEMGMDEVVAEIESPELEPQMAGAEYETEVVEFAPVEDIAGDSEFPADETSESRYGIFAH